MICWLRMICMMWHSVAGDAEGTGEAVANT